MLQSQSYVLDHRQPATSQSTERVRFVSICMKVISAVRVFCFVFALLVVFPSRVRLRFVSFKYYLVPCMWEGEARRRWEPAGRTHATHDARQRPSMTPNSIAISSSPPPSLPSPDLLVSHLVPLVVQVKLVTKVSRCLEKGARINTTIIIIGKRARHSAFQQRLHLQA